MLFNDCCLNTTAQKSTFLSSCFFFRLDVRIILSFKTSTKEILAYCFYLLQYSFFSPFISLFYRFILSSLNLFIKNFVFETFKDLGGAKDQLVKRLKDHLKEKERTLETAAEEKQKACEEKENELQQLRRALRDRDRLIEKVNAVAVEGEDKIKV